MNRPDIAATAGMIVWNFLGMAHRTAVDWRWLVTDGPGDNEDPYIELFHELRTSHTSGRRAPSASSIIGIAVAFVVGFALIITVVIALGRNNPDAGVTGSGIYVCEGERATIVGTDGDDVIRGTGDRDGIHARRGDDVVLRSTGADLICGGKGADELNGGRGEDTLNGGEGVDVCNGHQALDTFKGCETENQ